MKENNPKLMFPLRTLLQGRVKVAWVLIFVYLCLNIFVVHFKMLKSEI